MNRDRRDLMRVLPCAVLAVTGRSAHAQDSTGDPSQAFSRGETFHVKAFGALGDGKVIDSPAVNRAIEAVAAQGGGTLVFPAGTYVCFTIHLRSNVHLYLSPGCTILAAESPQPGETSGYRGGVYDTPLPQMEYPGGLSRWENSLFVGKNLKNISITGSGLIWGRGLSHGLDTGGPARGDDNRNFDDKQPGVGDKSIALYKCKNVLLRDFSILEAGHFAVFMAGCDHVTIDNLLVDTQRDGIDFDCCRFVHISNCTLNCPQDDAICPKSSYGLGYFQPTENVTITNCYVTGSYVLGSAVSGEWKKYPESAYRVPRCGKIKCGTSSASGFRNFTISNCVLEGSKGIQLESVDGGYLEDFAISNITMRDVVDVPFFLRLGRRNQVPKEVARPGTLRRVLISNVTVHNASAVASSLIAGLSDNLIEDIKISNCYLGHRAKPDVIPAGPTDPSRPFPDFRSIQVPELEDAYPEPRFFGPTPSHGFFIRHVRNLEMSHVEIAPEGPDPRPAVWLEDVHRADFLGLTAPGSPNFELRNVTDLRVLWSRAAPDIHLDRADQRRL